ncbi:hypothetical protein PG984_005390 [Apiospora sp. TS-2023a]
MLSSPLSPHYPVTGVPETFPEPPNVHPPHSHPHHHPHNHNNTMPFLSTAGQKVGHLFQDIIHPTTRPFGATTEVRRSPCTDIRESDDAYFIDIELPGVVTDDIRLNWTDSRVLLVEADAQRPPETVEEEEEAEDGGKLTRLWGLVGGNSSNNNSGSFNNKRRSSMFNFTSSNGGSGNASDGSNTSWKHPFHFLMRERRDCAFARAFSFHVDVDQGHVTTEVKDGLLHMRVPKLFMDDELSEIET